MKTAFSTGPGLFAVSTNKTDPNIPEGVARVLCARIEAYDITDSIPDNETLFAVLFPFAESDPRIARALLLLGHAIKENQASLEHFAR